MTTIDTNQINVPSSPADRKAVLDAMKEISASMTRIEGERIFIKEAISDLAKKFELPKKALAKMSKTYHKSSYNQDINEVENFQALYEAVTGETSL